jgi:VanZ family protein
MTKQNLSRPAERQETSVLSRALRYGPLLLWMVFISFASTGEFSALNTSRLVRPLILWFLPDLNNGQLATTHFAIRKLAHFLEYGLLAFLASRAFATSSFASIRLHWFRWGILLVLVYALVDEFHQSFVASRSGSIYDSVIDFIGGLTVLLVFRRCHRRSEKSELRPGS